MTTATSPQATPAAIALDALDALEQHRYMPCSVSGNARIRRWAACEGCDWHGPDRAEWHAVEADHRAHQADTIAAAIAETTARSERAAQATAWRRGLNAAINAHPGWWDTIRGENPYEGDPA